MLNYLERALFNFLELFDRLNCQFDGTGLWSPLWPQYIAGVCKTKSPVNWIGITHIFSLFPVICSVINLGGVGTFMYHARNSLVPVHLSLNQKHVRLSQQYIKLTNKLLDTWCLIYSFKIWVDFLSVLRVLTVWYFSPFLVLSTSSKIRVCPQRLLKIQTKAEWKWNEWEAQYSSEIIDVAPLSGQIEVASKHA